MLDALAMVMEPLHPLEHKILSSVGKGDSIDKIYEKTNLNRDKIRRALQWLKTKGLISLKEEIIEEVRLTKTGKSYVKKGLPETQFLRLLPATFKELRSKLTPKEFNVSMGMLKRHGEISVEKGVIRATTVGKKRLKLKKADNLLAKVEGLYYPQLRMDEQKTVDSLKKRGIVRVVVK
ncbi:MAG: hypothetical protein KAT35_03125, partial [Candidatus Aenigmarchaeota archaeon]|nr:hypothetical protein [Candidatus Aenigmarchaeota archaeon]